MATLRLPNREVRIFYRDTIKDWFSNTIAFPKYALMLKALVDGDTVLFRKTFTNFVLQSFSCFDISGKEPEKFYHAFVLGMLVSLSETHEVMSNKESGYGRYDVMVIPKNSTMPGIIIEFKAIDEDENESLEQAVDAALSQIEEKRYDIQLKARGISNIIKLGIAFSGKKVLVKENRG